MSIRLGAVALDCPDPQALADFYRQVLGLEVAVASPDLVALRGPGIFLTFERINEHVPPTWPTGAVPKQLHLDFAVTDLDAEEQRIIGLGATKAEIQPDASKWRVLIDPVGHPFCITVLFPVTT